MPESFNSAPADDEIDAQVLGSVMLLTNGDVSLFTDTSEPTPVVSDFICQADLRDIRGLLIASLHRWHKLTHAEINKRDWCDFDE